MQCKKVFTVSKRWLSPNFRLHLVKMIKDPSLTQDASERKRTMFEEFWTYGSLALSPRIRRLSPGGAPSFSEKYRFRKWSWRFLIPGIPRFLIQEYLVMFQQSIRMWILYLKSSFRTLLNGAIFRYLPTFFMRSQPFHFPKIVHHWLKYEFFVFVLFVCS